MTQTRKLNSGECLRLEGYLRAKCMTWCNFLKHKPKDRLTTFQMNSTFLDNPNETALFCPHDHLPSTSIPGKYLRIWQQNVQCV